MQRSVAELEAIIREKICRICSSRNVDASCGLEEPDTCALFRLFPRVAEAIDATDSDDVRDYIRAIRERVCSACRDQAFDGSCKQRTQVQCALDAYLLIVVDAIEEATGKTLRKADLVVL